MNAPFQSTLYALENKFPIRVLRAKITGSRWAFCGEADMENFPTGLSHRMRLDDASGVVIYNWNALTPEAQKEIHTTLRPTA